MIRITEDQAQQIADFRFANRLASENEAIRRLIELGINAAQEKNK